MKKIELIKLIREELLKINEKTTDYVIYHSKYSDVINEIEKYANKNGYTVDEDEFSNAFMDAFFKPKKGKTKRNNLTLYKNGKEQKKELRSQIYNRGTDSNTYELNMYIS